MTLTRNNTILVSTVIISLMFTKLAKVVQNMVISPTGTFINFKWNALLISRKPSEVSINNITLMLVSNEYLIKIQTKSTNNTQADIC